MPLSKIASCAQRRDMSAGGKEGSGSSPSKEGGDDDNENDFAMDDFGAPDELDDDIDTTLKKLEDNDEDVTPELASDLVARMVEATTRKFNERNDMGIIISNITPHTISALRASRISTNEIRAAGSELYSLPIEKKVTAELHIDLLNLSKSAREALELLAGPRLCGSYVKISCSQYPSKEENRAHIISQIDRLVSAAKVSVGEEVELTPLENWEDVAGEVEKQASDEVKEAGSLSLLLGEAKA